MGIKFGRGGGEHRFFKKEPQPRPGETASQVDQEASRRFNLIDQAEADRKELDRNMAEIESKRNRLPASVRDALVKQRENIDEILANRRSIENEGKQNRADFRPLRRGDKGDDKKENQAA